MNWRFRKPIYNLGIGSGLHGYQTGHMLIQLEEILVKEKPDGVLVYGDTNSTVAGALAASKIHIPVIHIEAGLRSFNKTMPEEINRIVTDHVSTLLFSPTEKGVQNLLEEGIKTGQSPPFSPDNPGIFNSGDVMYDNTLFFIKKAAHQSKIIAQLGLKGKDYILATVHRPSNTDSEQRMESILRGMLAITHKYNLQVILPLHPRTEKMLERHPNRKLLTQLSVDNGIQMIPAVTYLDMIELEFHSRVIITDSGGVQKEAWFMKKPVLIMRSETEWTEITESGNGTLVNADTDKLVTVTGKYLSEPPTKFPEFYGNGDAAGDILQIVTARSWE